MIVQNMSEKKSHLENRDPRSVRMPYHPRHPSRLHHCKDSVRNDPKMILGSHVRGSNNVICRAWVFKN